MSVVLGKAQNQTSKLFPKRYLNEDLRVLFFFFFFNTFWLLHMTCRVIVSTPGTEPTHLALEVLSLNNWISMEVPPENYS